MPSAAARGSYYQAKTKRYLQDRGFVVTPLQLSGWINTPHGWRPVKRDSFGADLLAVNASALWFVQCKGGATWRSGLAAARAAFARYPLGPGCSQVILGWPPRAREPEIEICAVGPKAAGQAVKVPPRRTPKPLPLFAAAGR